MYINNIEKYGESSIKSLNYKFIIFINLYKRAEILDEILHIVFFTILKSMTLEYYYFSYSIRLTI